MSQTFFPGFLREAAAPRVIPFAVFITFIAVQGLLRDVFPGAIADAVAMWLYPVRSLAVAIVLIMFWPRYGEFRNAPPLRVADWLLAVVSGLLVFVLWINLDQPWAVVGSGASFDPTHADGSGINWPLAGLRLAGLALVVPLMEELFWRSFLMRWLDRKDFLGLDPRQVSRVAFMVTAALFALEHTQWLAGLIAGMVYNGLFVYTRNLWAPVVSHTVTNGVLGVWILATGNWRFW